VNAVKDSPDRFLSQNYGRKLMLKNKRSEISGRLVGYSPYVGGDFWLIVEVESSHGFITCSSGGFSANDILHPAYIPPANSRFASLLSTLDYEFEADRTHYPHTCLRCGKPAYVGAVPAATDCSNAKCPTRKR